MKPEIKARWLEALRSGEYLQGRNAMCAVHDGERRFCCLGVLTDLYRKGHGGEWEASASSGCLHYKGNVTTPFHVVESWGGLARRQVNALLRMSDWHMATFAQIADHIEENL